MFKSGEDYYQREFKGLELDSAVFDNVEFEKCEFVDCKWIDVGLLESRIIDCEFKDCYISALKLSGTSISTLKVKESKIIGINWSDLESIDEVEFVKCDLSMGNFSGLDLREAVFDECKIEESKFLEVNLSKAKLNDCDLRDSLFHMCELKWADFRGSRSYMIDPRNNKIDKAQFSFPEVVGLLKPIDIEIEGI